MRPVAIAGAALLGALAAFFAWEVGFALLVGWQAHSWTLWARFFRGLELVLPARSAIAEWSNPIVKTLAARAMLGTTVAVMLVGIIVRQVVNAVRGVKPPMGGARLATEKDLRKANLFDGRPGYSIFLGRFDGKDIRYSGDSHIYVNGPTRAGKGVGFVLPNALEWRGSLIGLDIKREMWTEVGAARIAMGQRVFMYSPGSAESHCWNPLDLVSPWPERATDVANIARSLIPKPETGDTYWAETARGLFAGLLAYVLDSKTMEGRRTIKSALKMMSRGRNLAAVMAEIIANEPDLNEFVVDKFRQHLGREEKQRMSFEAHITTALDAWNNALVDDATSRSDFNVADLRRNPFTILIGTPVGNFGSVEAIVRLLVQQVHDVLLKHLPGVDEPHRLLLLLDEFYQFGRMPEIVDRAPLVAGYGFQIAVIAQGLTQLDVRYGKPTRDMLVGNMDVKLLIGVGDEPTAKYCADEIGKHYVRRENWGSSVGGGQFLGGAPRSSRTTQGRWELEPIMPSETIRRLDAQKSVLLIRGQYATILDKVNFFTDHGFMRKASAVAHFKSRLTVPDVSAPPPSLEWIDNTPVMPPKSALGERHDAALASVMEEADRVFAEPEPFRRAFLAAMDETRNSWTAELCRALRVDPQSIAPLRSARKRWTKMPSVSDRTKALRSEIIAARNLLNADRAEHAATSAAASAPPAPAEEPKVALKAGARSDRKRVTGTPATGSTGEAMPEVRAAPAVMDVEHTAMELAASIDSAFVNRSAPNNLAQDLAVFRQHAALFLDTPDDLPALLSG